ncbi:MAG TPA: DegT/DnrJ/EryC1/StrS family aminotransferase [Bacteroidales bacterium]|nr:DegT/DnrJ/EryC1/StrS family aminotransferase [Bacteroidales bacterium]
MKRINFNKFNSFYNLHELEANELITKTLQSGKYIRDKNTEILEQNLCTLCNRKFALTTASCTDAIFFALKTVGIKAGDEVILPSFSYIASLSPILMCGAIPVFVDIKPDSLDMNLDIVTNIITKKTKAIIFVQLFGNITDLSKLKEICANSNIFIIEDSAQSIGSKLNDIPCASQGDISCLSFDPTKIVSAYGTGGAVLTNNDTYYHKLQKLIHHGRNEQGEFDLLGYNSKISEVNAALINLQLNHLDEIITGIRDIAKKYIHKLNRIPEIQFVKSKSNCISTYHKFVIIAEKRDELKHHLNKNGIETRIHYTPLLHEQKLLRDFRHITHDLSASKEIKKKVLSLPIYPGLKNKEIDYICDCIINFYKI